MSDETYSMDGLPPLALSPGHDQIVRQGIDGDLPPMRCEVDGVSRTFWISSHPVSFRVPVGRIGDYYYAATFDVVRGVWSRLDVVPPSSPELDGLVTNDIHRPAQALIGRPPGL